MSLESSRSTPGVAIVYVGHTQIGGWCECGALACICDPGEIPPGGLTVQEDEKTVSNDEDVPLAELGMIVLAFLTAFFFWNRIRA